MSKRIIERHDQLPVSNKKICTNSTVQQENATEKVLRDLSLLFPKEKFVDRVPPVVLKHMIYSCLPNRTKADKEMNDLQQRGIIRLFKLGGDQESLAVLFKDQFLHLIEKRCSKSLVITKFTTKILDHVNEISIEKAVLLKAGFTEDDIKCLVQECLLTIRSATTYWFCFPGAGEFMKSYNKGRQTVLTAVKKSKYHQILQNDLASRNFKKTVNIGVLYHIHDLIGSDAVTCETTTSGNLLKISN